MCDCDVIKYILLLIISGMMQVSVLTQQLCINRVLLEKLFFLQLI